MTKTESAFEVLHDKGILVGLKGKIYHMVVRPALLYGYKCWVIQENQVRRVMVAEIGLIWWMCCHKRLDRIKNEVNAGKVKVAPIDGKMRKNRPRLFGHVRDKLWMHPLDVRGLSFIGVGDVKNDLRRARTI